MTKLPRLPNAGNVLEARYTAKQMREYASKAVSAEREACAKLIEPDTEHRKDAPWGYLGGDEGVELLDGAASKIRARGEA